MADSYDFYNPDVKDVPIPNMDVTRPISQPKANLAGQYIGQGLETGLKDVGQLVKDTLHLTDYTNKEELSNRIHAAADPQRDVFTASQAAINRVMSAGGARAEADDSDITGAVNAVAGRANPQEPNAPEGIQGLNQKLKARVALREQQTQGEMYYRSQIDMLAKQYRSQYPQYRDYIDKTFSQAGFGNPANEYLQSVQRANAALAAASDNKDNKTRDWLYAGSKELDAQQPGLFAQAMKEYQSGEKNELQIMKEYGPIIAHSKGVQDRQENLNASQKTATDLGHDAFAMTARNVAGDFAVWLDHTPQGNMIRAYMDLPPEQRNDKADIEVAQMLDNQKQILTQKAARRDSQQYEVQTVDATGKPVFAKDAAGNPLKQSNFDRMNTAGIGYGTAIDQGLTGLSALRAQIPGNVELGKAVALKNSAVLSETTQALLKTRFGQFLSSTQAIQNMAPEFARQYIPSAMAEAIGPNLSQDVQGFILGNIERMAQEGVPLSRLIDDMHAVGADSPEANGAMYRGAMKGLSTPGITPQITENLVRSLYSKDRSILTGMDTPNKVQRFGEMSSEETLRSIEKGNNQAVVAAKTWILQEGQTVSAPVLNELGRITANEGSAAANQYHAAYDDVTHRLTFAPNANAGDINKPSNAALRNHLNMLNQRVAEPLNTVFKGYANVLKGQSPEDVNKAVLDLIQGSGYTDNKVWESLSQQGVARAKAKADAAKKPEDK